MEWYNYANYEVLKNMSEYIIMIAGMMYDVVREKLSLTLVLTLTCKLKGHHDSRTDTNMSDQDKQRSWCDIAAHDYSMQYTKLLVRSTWHRSQKYMSEVHVQISKILRGYSFLCKWIWGNLSRAVVSVERQAHEYFFPYAAASNFFCSGHINNNVTFAWGPLHLLVHYLKPNSHSV